MVSVFGLCFLLYWLAKSLFFHAYFFIKRRKVKFVVKNLDKIEKFSHVNNRRRHAFFVVLYNTKKISFFTSDKDKVPIHSKSNVVYQIACPCCNKSYIGKTFRWLDDRLSEHAKYHQTSAIAQDFLECENAQFVSNLNNLYDRLTNTHFHTNTTSCLKAL